MERHFEERSQILLPTTNTEGLFQQKIEQLRTQRNTLQSALDSDLSRRFGILLNTLSLELSEILFSNFLATIYDRPTYKALVALLKVMSPLVRTTQEHELEMAISQHQSVLE